MTDICVGNTTMAQSHYLNQCWNIVNWNLRNKRQWNCNRNSYIFIQEMHLKMSPTKWRPFCLNVLNQNFTKVCSSRPHPVCDWRGVIISSDNGLAPNRRPAILWPKDDQFRDASWYVELRGDESSLLRPKQFNHHSADDIFVCIKIYFD